MVCQRCLAITKVGETQAMRFYIPGESGAEVMDQKKKPAGTTDQAVARGCHVSTNATSIVYRNQAALQVPLRTPRQEPFRGTVGYIDGRSLGKVLVARMTPC